MQQQASMCTTPGPQNQRFTEIISMHAFPTLTSQNIFDEQDPVFPAVCGVCTVGFFSVNTTWLQFWLVIFWFAHFNFDYGVCEDGSPCGQSRQLPWDLRTQGPQMITIPCMSCQLASVVWLIANIYFNHSPWLTTGGDKGVRVWTSSLALFCHSWHSYFCHFLYE